MASDQTFKERMSRWYHHETLRWSAVGAFTKLATEGLFWAAIMGPVVSIAVLLPIPLVGDVAFLSTRYWQIAAGLTGSATIAEFCMFTREPEKF